MQRYKGRLRRRVEKSNLFFYGHFVYLYHMEDLAGEKIGGHTLALKVEPRSNGNKIRNFKVRKMIIL